MGATSSVNQKEFVSLARLCLDTNVAASRDGSSFVIELMRMVRRLDLNTSFPTETEVLTSQFDLALCKTYTSIRAARLGIQE